MSQQSKKVESWFDDVRQPWNKKKRKVFRIIGIIFVFIGLLFWLYPTYYWAKNVELSQMQVFLANWEIILAGMIVASIGWGMYSYAS